MVFLVYSSYRLWQETKVMNSWSIIQCFWTFSGNKSGSTWLSFQITVRRSLSFALPTITSTLLVSVDS